MYTIYDRILNLRSTRGHTGPVTGLSFEPNNGKLLASCSSDMSAKIWNCENYNCMKTLRGHDHSISSVIFMIPSCDFVMTCSRDQTMKYWEISSGYCNRTFSGAHTHCDMENLQWTTHSGS